jgi:hypothetical protein
VLKRAGFEIAAKIPLPGRRRGNSGGTRPARVALRAELVEDVGTAVSRSNGGYNFIPLDGFDDGVGSSVVGRGYGRKNNGFGGFLVWGVECERAEETLFLGVEVSCSGLVEWYFLWAQWGGSTLGDGGGSSEGWTISGFLYCCRERSGSIVRVFYLTFGISIAYMG